MSVAGGFDQAIERAVRIGAQTFQIFTKSNNQWAAPPIRPESARCFRQELERTRIGPAFAHAAYLINVGSSDPVLHQRSREALKVEMDRAGLLGLPFVILHPGSRKQDPEPDCLRRIAEAVAWVLDQTPGSPVALLYETAAGQGSSVGDRFEQLAELLRLTGRPARTGICFDTAHVFAAGYDLRTADAYGRTMKEFDRIVGLKQLKAIHLNDSKKPIGSRVDRHEQIGQGAIGLEGFRCLMNDLRLRSIPMVLETPKDEKTLAEDVMNLKTLRGLIR